MCKENDVLVIGINKVLELCNNKDTRFLASMLKVQEEAEEGSYPFVVSMSRPDAVFHISKEHADELRDIVDENEEELFDFVHDILPEKVEDKEEEFTLADTEEGLRDQLYDTICSILDEYSGKDLAKVAEAIGKVLEEASAKEKPKGKTLSEVFREEEEVEQKRKAKEEHTDKMDKWTVEKEKATPDYYLSTGTSDNTRLKLDTAEWDMEVLLALGLFNGWLRPDPCLCKRK
jgi:hypothetical protein